MNNKTLLCTLGRSKNTIINYLKTIFSYIVIDLPSIIGETTVSIMNEADIILLLGLANLSSIRSLQKCYELFEKIGYNSEKIKLIINRYIENSEVKIKDIEDELESIKREFLEEIGIDLDTSKLEYLFTFSQEVIENEGKFLDNQFYDVYLLEMDLDIDELNLQEEEVSEIKNIYYKDFEQMIINKDKDIVNHPKEWENLFKILHQKYD